ncbi:carbohydrate sulfotransferase 11 [Contarinia nasturtii]|uniref:carbohydrate sulfotransferase 11 n=1 Tax=Contarinia nasturtii TaxID=265458 RepID=UPI0012D41344|nr:carbohydrate sulfotransferase 11 [Contarinia nasturtii]XP_031617870.1 carbohydrate sulfotransferase 11 [Contarinia nasturtii]
MRAHRTQCRCLKRFSLCIIAIGLLPILIVYFLVSDQLYYRIKRTDNENGTQFVGDDSMSRSLSQKEMEMIEERMRQRTVRLAQKCTEFGLDIRRNDSLHRPNSWEFLVNKRYHLVWCNVFKAASTSWMYNFNILAGYSPEFLRKSNIVPLELARKRYERVTVTQLEKALNVSVSFLIVRHPFERLLSAYRDKIMFAIPHSLHDKLGNKIIRKYRKNRRLREPKWPLFSEFVSYLLDEMSKRSPKTDMHWVPITEFCTPCQIKFDVIAKFETLDEDQRFLIERADLRRHISPQWKNSGKGKNTQELTTKFFSQLSMNQLDRLCDIYKYDLQLFDYAPEPFYNIVRNASKKVV